MSQPIPARPARRGHLLESVLLVAFFASRLLGTERLAIYMDEATLIIWARDIMHGLWFQPLKHGRWLHVAWLALLGPSGPESPWLARASVAILTVASGAAAIALGRWIGKRRGAGLLAGLLYIVAPLGLYSERQALADAVMTACFGVVAILSIRLARRRGWPLTLALTGALLLSVLAKFSGAFLYVTPLAAAWLISPPGRMRWRAIGRAALAIGLAVALVMGFFLLADTQVAPERRMILGGGNFQLSSWCTWPPCTDGQVEPGVLAQRAERHLRFSAQYGLTYLGLPFLALLIVALIWPLVGEGPRGPTTRRALFLALIGLLPVVPVMIVSDLFPSRYYNFSLVTLAPLAGYALFRLADGLLRVRAPVGLRSLAGVLAAALVALPVAWVVPADLAFLSRPESLRLPGHDTLRCDLREYGGGGHGYDRVADVLNEWVQSSGRRANVIAVEGMMMSVHWGERVGTVRGWEGDEEGQAREVAEWLEGSDGVFFVDEVPVEPIPPHPFDASLVEVARIQVPQCGDVTLRVRRLSDPGPRLKGYVYERVFLRPEALGDDYRALADYLGADGGVDALIVYPPNQAETLAGLTDLPVHAVGDTWPLDVEAASAELETLSGRYERLGVVWLDETRGDPGRSLETWLNTHLFKGPEMWFGPLRLAVYRAAPAEVPFAPVGVTFGGIARLDAAALIDAQTAPGESVRVGLDWVPVGKTDVSYKVFAHVLSNGGLLAQHDDVPMGGLSPTNTWTPGQRVPDRFVIPIPADAPPGVYQVRVGLYDPTSGTRLPSGEGADSALIGTLTVAPAQ
jgi:hypothetical protein